MYMYMNMYLCSRRGGGGASGDPAHVRRMQSFSRQMHPWITIRMGLETSEHTCIYLCIHSYRYVCISFFMYVCMSICLYECMHKLLLMRSAYWNHLSSAWLLRQVNDFLYMHVSVSMKFLWVYKYMYVCMCLWTFIYIQVYTRLRRSYQLCT